MRRKNGKKKNTRNVILEERENVGKIEGSKEKKCGTEDAIEVGAGEEEKITRD